MKIEMHVIQNFPVHCLNRDDNNMPKDCMFGGVRRARVSSQAFKRAMRDYFSAEGFFTAEQRATRTKRLVAELVRRLVAAGRDEKEATAQAERALSLVKLKVPAKKNVERKTAYLVYVAHRDIDALAQLLDEHWDAFEALKTKKGKLSKELNAELLNLFATAEQTPELALFGRMIADNPDWNMEASCQVAHAISTHRVDMEFDFFTAIDDLKPDDATGSDMMCVAPFNSSCFYRYAALDVDELVENLGSGDEELPQKTVEAFLRGFVAALPSGKQNSMTAKTMPSYILAVVRESGQAWMLSNAFAKPIAAPKHGGDDIIQRSITALENHFAQHLKMYGKRGLGARLSCSLEEREEDAEASADIKTTESLDALVEQTLAAAFANGAP